ncbi:type II toxin-antitoxin system RelE/ParE family toxin [Crocosphaera sp.]|uniref:type II toxin-antitoxin system RelE/ParE family toxin n=1 Tax=Crocosphaera sp. TaxID=2729996 RepID=UPI00261F6E6B|nr:type II toxin-antitoxin system RelE/ParE family toxin [Crocosphaera sp.]MDJ0579887.1 type II toxin-antitoxin system RelE/ParE family toxin [Crocosphaera sp.]
MENQPKQILIYKTSEGKVPFEEWLNKLKDGKTRAKIKTRLTRVTLGNLGDYKSVGDGVCELRINYGKGYRIYFAQKGSILIILLCGGDKDSQQKDIRQAKQYWLDYQRNQGNDKD